MKVLRIDLDDDEDPSTVDVRMTVDEAAAIYAFLGHVAPVDVSKAAGWDRWSDAVDSAATGLSSGFFNRFWDDGVNDVLPRGFTFDGVAAARAERVAAKAAEA